MGIRVGVIGTGHFGRFHALKLAARGCLSGLHNLDPARAAAVSAETGAPVLSAAELALSPRDGAGRVRVLPGV